MKSSPTFSFNVPNWSLRFGTNNGREIHSFLGDDIFTLETLWLLILNPFVMDEKMLTEKKRKRKRSVCKRRSTYLPTYLPTPCEGRWRNRSQPFALCRLIIRVRVWRRRLHLEDEKEAEEDLRLCNTFGFVALLRSELRFWESSEDLTLLQWGPRYAYFASLSSFFFPDHLCWNRMWWIASRTEARLVRVYVISSNCVMLQLCFFAPIDWLPLLSLPWLLFYAVEKKTHEAVEA